MANLIITVIAIALVAVASLMGAYYGGSAFLNNQSAAGASAFLNQGQQVAGAFQAYLNDHGNTVPTGWATLISSNYLQSQPVTPAISGGVSGLMNVVINANGHYYAYADMGAPTTANTYTTTDNASSACVKIIKTATGNTVTGTLTAVAAGSISAAGGASGNGTYGCAPLTTAPTGSAGWTGATLLGAHYMAEYKLY